MNIDTYKKIEGIVQKGNDEILNAFNAAGIKEVPSVLKLEGFKTELDKELTINQQIEVTQKVYKYLITKLAPLFVNYRHVLLSNGFSVNIQDGQLVVIYSFNESFLTGEDENSSDVLENMLGLERRSFHDEVMKDVIELYGILNDDETSSDEEEILNNIKLTVQRNVKKDLDNLEYLIFMSEINDDFLQVLNDAEVFAKEIIENIE